MKHENQDNYTFGFETSCDPAAPPESAWTCSLACRQVAFAGPTEAHAIGGMLKYVAELARSGALNPARPSQIGAGPIQHALEIVQEQLAQCLGFRYDHYKELCADANANAQTPTQSAELHDAAVRDPRWSRRNDEIAALGTAIAALARVKEL